MTRQKFTSKISIINGNPYVTPPTEVLETIFQQAGKNTSPIPIRGKINGADYQQSLVRYQDDWRLYINGIMAKHAGLEYSGSIAAIVGEKVDIEVEFDTMPPTYPMLPQLKMALIKDAKAKAAFDALTPGRQKEIVRYLGFMKTPESLAKNVERVISHLKDEETDALYPLFHKQQA